MNETTRSLISRRVTSLKVSRDLLTDELNDLRERISKKSDELKATNVEIRELTESFTA